MSEPEDFTRIVFGNTDTLSYFSFVSDDVALVQHKPNKEDVCKGRDVNVFIGAFTTAHARLELYELMDRLGDRLLYSDTDSVVFVSRDGDWEPPLGDHLGELMSEIDDGDFITEFCASGPKSYGFQTSKGKVCMKAKGITLNAKNSQAIRLETLIGLVDSYVTSHDSTKYILAHTENIVRDKRLSRCTTNQSLKGLRWCIINADFCPISPRFLMATDQMMMHRGSMDVSDFDFRLQHPFSCVISGPSNSGKSYFVKLLLEKGLNLISKKIENIVWLYDCWQPLYDDVLKLYDIKFVQGIPESLNDDDLLPVTKRSFKGCLRSTSITAILALFI